MLFEAVECLIHSGNKGYDLQWFWTEFLDPDIFDLFRHDFTGIATDQDNRDIIADGTDLSGQLKAC